MSDRQADILVVGSGGAGLAAAIEAAARGAKVTILEALAEPGGATRVSGAGCCIAGSPLQERLGLHDSYELALDDWLTFGGPSVDQEWASRYLADSVPELFVWLAEQGIEWIGLHENEGNRVPRWHSPRNAGVALADALLHTASTYPIDLQLNTRVTDLVQESGRVVGVIADGPSGPRELRAESVLIASGGFNNNVEMVRRFATQVPPGGKVLLGGGRGAAGGGHRVLERLGAQFVNMDVVWMYPYATPDYRDPSGLRGLVVRGLDGDVWVNQQGRRFHDESLRGGSSGTPALLRQDPPTCWTIIDARIHATMTIADPQYRRGHTVLRDEIQRLLDESPHAGTGQTPGELADAIGVDRGALSETIRTHNSWLAAGLERDPDFGRPLANLQPLDQPPFYALQFFPLARKNLGGVRTNLECQVLDTADRPIPGLYAAGEVAGMAGGRINGRAALEGTMIGPSLYSGKVAGRAMVGAFVRS